MVKKLGYYLFAAFFALFRIFPLRENKIFLVATHDDSPEGNIGLVREAFRQRRPELRFHTLTKRDGIRRPFSFFIVRAYHMATAGTIIMDNIFMPMAYTPLSKRAKVVQLWHGTGTIKKFALDSDTGEVARLAERANRRITHLIVNSEQTKKQYAGAFGVPEERVYILGLPRTDLILDDERIEAKRQEFFRQYPELAQRRCVLYAPTFRDDEVGSRSWDWIWSALRPCFGTTRRCCCGCTLMWPRIFPVSSGKNMGDGSAICRIIRELPRLWQCRTASSPTIPPLRL